MHALTTSQSARQANGTFGEKEPLTSTPTTAYHKTNLSSQTKSGFQLKPLSDNLYMKEYSYTVEEQRNERNSQFSPKQLGGFKYTDERPDGESTTSPLSSPQDKTGFSQPGYKRATATAFTYKPPEITRTTTTSPSTRPLSTYRSAMNAPTTVTSPSGKSSTLPSSRLRESTSAYSWSTDKEDRVRSEKAEERQFAQLINTKDVKEGARKEKSASTDKMNALFGSGKSKKFGATEKQSSTTKSSIFSSFMKSSEEKVEKKKQLSQSTSNVLEQKKTSSTSSLINKYNNLTSSPIGSSSHLRPHEPPVKQIDSDSESASSSENSMDEYASEDLKTDPQTGLTSASYLTSKLGPSASLPRSAATTNSLGSKTAQRYEPQPTVRTSLTIQPSSQPPSSQLGSGAVDGAASSPFSRPTTKPPITPKPVVPSKPTMTTASLTNKVSPYERQSKFGNLSTGAPSPIASQTGSLKSSYLKDNFLKADHKPASLSPSLKPQVPIKLQSSTQQPSPSYLATSPGQGSPSSAPSNPSMYSPYNNALVTTTTVPHVQQPKITHLSRKRTVKNADGSIQEDEEVIEPSGLPPVPQTYISTATFTPSKPQIVGAFPPHERNAETVNGDVHRIVNRFNDITRSPNLTYSNKLVH